MLSGLMTEVQAKLYLDRCLTLESDTAGPYLYASLTRVVGRMSFSFPLKSSEEAVERASKVSCCVPPQPLPPAKGGLRA